MAAEETGFVAAFGRHAQGDQKSESALDLGPKPSNQHFDL